MKQTLKVAIYSGPLTSEHSVRGIGIHTRMLIEELEKIPNINITLTDLHSTTASQFNVIHYPNFHPYFFSFPFSVPINSVITIHDLIPLIYPYAYPAGLKGRLRFQIQKLLLPKFKAVITISETSKKDIIRFLNIPEEKIHVIYLAPRKIFKRLRSGKWQYTIQKKFNLPHKFVLYVGDVNYNKNLNSLAKACKKINVPLVMVGKQAANNTVDNNHPENKPFANLLQDYGKDKNLIRLGFVEDKILVKIYNLASVYVQPSLYEGFGLPVLEAMACGVPTICSRTQALCEIAGDNTEYFEPLNVNDMANGISKLLTNKTLRSNLSKKGLKHISKFTWEKTARETIDVYQQIAK